MEAQLIKTLDRNEIQHQTFIIAHQIKLIQLPLPPNYERQNKTNKAPRADLPLFFRMDSMGSPTIWLSKAPRRRGDEGPRSHIFDLPFTRHGSHMTALRSSCPAAGLTVFYNRPGKQVELLAVGLKERTLSLSFVQLKFI